MLCPNCLVEIEKFDSGSPQQGKTGCKCPSCKDSVPESYISDYREYPPVVFFLSALPQHGKRHYLARLFSEFESVGKNWQEFSYTPIEEANLEHVRKYQHALEKGEKLESDRRLFKKPGILKLDGVPDFGKCQLLVIDAAAEKEPEPAEMRRLSGYFSRNHVTAFLLSLSDVKSATELTDFITRYKQIVSKYGANSAEQTLIVALTKCDALLSDEDLPEYIRQAILGRQKILNEDADEAEELSGVIESWLDNRPETMNFVRRAKADFKDVKFTITVAGDIQDEEASSTSETEKAPIEVWSLLKMVWKAQLSYLKEAQHQQIKQKIGTAAKDSVTDASRGVMGGLLGLIEGAVWGALLWAICGGFEAFLIDNTLSEILKGAIKWGAPGIIWGAVIWLIAGISDAVKNTESLTRSGVRAGAISGFFLNAVFAAIIWGLAQTISGIISSGVAFSFKLLIENALSGVIIGAKLGAILGAVWGLTVSGMHRIETRSLA
ncbi:MAG: hypothetical protein HQ568_12305, partial [Calditrichaeota bacterium]|nr:hypothetical protein [Calditrichota bacterium]